MAKKKAEEAQEQPQAQETPKFSEQGGKGKKQCPACKMYIGARVTGKCPNPACSHEFVAGEKKPKSDKVVQQNLDFGEALEMLAKVNAYAKDFGGVAKMIKAVDDLDEIAVQCGGLDGLKKALNALKTL